MSDHWNIGQDDPFDHFPWTWTPYLNADGGPSLGGIHTPNGRRADGTTHTYWGIAHDIWEPTGRLICKAVNQWAHNRFGTPIPLDDADFGGMAEIVTQGSHEDVSGRIDYGPQFDEDES